MRHYFLLVWRLQFVILSDLAGLQLLDVPVHPLANNHFKFLVELDFKLAKGRVNFQNLLVNDQYQIFFLFLRKCKLSLVVKYLGVLKKVLYELFGFMHVFEI